MCGRRVAASRPPITQCAIRCAAAFAGSFTCADKDSTLDASASTAAAAVAEAYAAAIVDLEQVCESSGYAGACSYSDSFIKTWARAEARAVANAWAGTLAGCSCDVSVQLAAEAFGKVFVDVANSVTREFCVEGAHSHPLPPGVYPLCSLAKNSLNENCRPSASQVLCRRIWQTRRCE